ncbi:MAG: hypothetical protein LW720_07645 [Pirellula sp.]|nr:hypothetical protein [Pirellula sp.]
MFAQKPLDDRLDDRLGLRHAFVDGDRDAIPWDQCKIYRRKIDGISKRICDGLRDIHRAGSDRAAELNEFKA